MKVGLVLYGSLHQLSGGYFYDRMLVEGLRSGGDEVEVLSFQQKKYMANLLDGFSDRLSRRLADRRFDVVIQDELSHPSLFLSNRRNPPGLPIVTIVHHLRSSEHHPVLLRTVYRRVEAAYLRTVEGAIYNSHVTCTTVEDMIGSSLPAVVAHPGRDHLAGNFDSSVIDLRARREGPLQVVFLGNLVPRKGLHLLLEALSAVPISEWHLMVVGSTEFDRAYSAQVRRAAAALNGNVSLLGALPHAELGAYLRKAHVLAMPSSYEGFGIAYLDGMGFGLPALATTAGGASELVRDGENGFLVRPNDVAELRARLVLLCGDRSLLARMGKQALADYLEHPTWDETTNAVRRFLTDLIGAQEAAEIPLETGVQRTGGGIP